MAQIEGKAKSQQKVKFDSFSGVLSNEIFEQKMAHSSYRISVELGESEMVSIKRGNGGLQNQVA